MNRKRERRATSADTFAVPNAGRCSLSRTRLVIARRQGIWCNAIAAYVLSSGAAGESGAAGPSIAFILLRLARSICCGQGGGSNHCWVAVKFIATDCAQSISACGPLLLKYCWPPPFARDIKNSDCRSEHCPSDRGLSLQGLGDPSRSSIRLPRPAANWTAL